ncbi:MAG: energy transducer TonB [Ignavibacteriae bacterium]|nr:MAG: energy transducer TonB [Ignavibacteriota bacterium]
MVNGSPRLGRVSYGAKELQRVYIRQMSAAFIFAVALTIAILSSLQWIINPDSFNPPPQHVVRIVAYSEIELPHSFSSVEIGMDAYPVIQDHSASSEASLLDESHPASAYRSTTNSRKQRIPGERLSGEGLGSLPGPIGVDKIQADDKSSYPNDMGNIDAPADRHDIAGGSGESSEPWRKGGRPVAGKSGEPPSGVDRSGIGSSSRPSAGTTPYGFGSGEGGDGVGNGAFSLRWLQGMTRRKLSGELPKYPQGTNVSAQVRILTIVLPDGTVRSVQPEQKANRLLEDAAMKAVRFWKFEPLASSLPQVEQSCIITFSFKLK